MAPNGNWDGQRAQLLFFLAKLMVKLGVYEKRNQALILPWTKLPHVRFLPRMLRTPVETKNILYSPLAEEMR